VRIRWGGTIVANLSDGVFPNRYFVLESSVGFVMWRLSVPAYKVFKYSTPPLLKNSQQLRPSQIKKMTCQRNPYWVRVGLFTHNAKILQSPEIG
jgi:hypothetical protein